MPVEKSANGSTIITGPEIKLFQLLTIRAMLGLEAKGMKHSRGKSSQAWVKQHFGWTGNASSLHAQLDAYIKQNYSQPANVTTSPEKPEIHDGIILSEN